MAARTETGNQRSEAEDALQVRRDHDAIAGLADDLLPALIAKLAASGLGEIEVRQGGWKARLRMPAGWTRRGAAPPGPPTATPPTAAPRPRRGSAVHSRSDDRHAVDVEDVSDEPARVAAKSPAVGIYNPRKDLAVGMRVRSGDRIGQVNVLGVNQDVISPVDGLIGSSLAEAGEAVEYGQELVRIELPERDDQRPRARSIASPPAWQGSPDVQQGPDRQSRRNRRARSCGPAGPWASVPWSRTAKPTARAWRRSSPTRPSASVPRTPGTATSPPRP